MVYSLQDLLKHTPKDHPDFPLLQDALRISQNFLSSINEEIDPRRTAVTTPKGEVRFNPKKTLFHYLARMPCFIPICSGSSAGERWLPCGGVRKLPEATPRLPLHRPAALCQNEEDLCWVSFLLCFFSHSVCNVLYYIIYVCT